MDSYFVLGHAAHLLSSLEQSNMTQKWTHNCLVTRACLTGLVTCRGDFCSFPIMWLLPPLPPALLNTILEGHLIYRAQFSGGLGSRCGSWGIADVRTPPIEYVETATGGRGILPPIWVCPDHLPPVLPSLISELHNSTRTSNANLFSVSA